MEKKLNLQAINQKISELGLSLTEIGKNLNVSKEAVSQWLREDSYPRPQHLLKLSNFLKLSYSDIVLMDNSQEPIVAFRKVRNAKTTDIHYQRAKEMGFALEQLVKFVPFELLTKSIELIDPRNEYDYIQQAVRVVRDKISIKKVNIEPSDLIKVFTLFKTILIPVLHGDKKNHENALHIKLPKSSTNWVYINLDTKLIDFKFWLVHELAHVLTPNLAYDQAEEFADNFAGAFLFPGEVAIDAYNNLSNLNDSNSLGGIIFNLAKRYTISPYTIIKEVNKYAKYIGKEEIFIPKSLHPRIQSFVKTYPRVSQKIFDEIKPLAKDYIEVLEREYDFEFFSILRKYASTHKVTNSFIRNILNVTIPDSKEIENYLNHATNKNTD